MQFSYPVQYSTSNPVQNAKVFPGWSASGMSQAANRQVCIKTNGFGNSVRITDCINLKKLTLFDPCPALTLALPPLACIVTVPGNLRGIRMPLSTSPFNPVLHTEYSILNPKRLCLLAWGIQKVKQ